MLELISWRNRREAAKNRREAAKKIWAFRAVRASLDRFFRLDVWVREVLRLLHFLNQTCLREAVARRINFAKILSKGVMLVYAEAAALAAGGLCLPHM